MHLFQAVRNSFVFLGLMRDAKLFLDTVTVTVSVTILLLISVGLLHHLTTFSAVLLFGHKYNDGMEPV